MNLKKCLAIAILSFSVLHMNAQSETSSPEVGDKVYKSLTDRILNDESLMHIKLDTRVDYQSVFTNGDNTENSFRGQTLKLRIAGEIMPGIRYYLRHRLNKSQAATRENYGSATDHAYIQLDAGEHFTFSIGKQSVQFGTFEYDVNPADIYMASMCYDELDAYKTGVNVAYKTGDQVFNLQVLNSDSPYFASPEYSQKALAGLFLWEGNLFNNLLKTRYGYAILQHSNKRFYNWVTIGNQINVGKLSADVDWYWGRQNMDYGSVVGIEGMGLKEVKDITWSVDLRYDLGKFKPSLKGIYDNRKDIVDGGSYKNLGIQGAIEYYPFEGKAKDLRFHAMYAFKNTSFHGNYDVLADVNQSTILTGVRWLFTVR